MRSKWLYILLGNDGTGKTTFQKNLVKLLSDDNKDHRLDCNLLFQVTHPHIIRKIRTFSIGNRSYQEKLPDYRSVKEYFKNHFKNADMCFISSHVNGSSSACLKDIEQMIVEGNRRLYNVCGVFFENSMSQSRQDNELISALHWDEKLLVDNPITDQPEQQDAQLRRAAEELVQMLVERTRGW